MTGRQAPPPVLCRVCGAPGRLYTSGRWCDQHSPHPPQPAAPEPARSTR